MEYSLGNIYHGFKLLREEKIKEIQSDVKIFEHVKSGARLINLANNDDDKLFSIGFRTTPFDSTGVAHILEHSVLCGSRKFRTSDPFGDMSKSSLHTFMNAMTYTDKTIYPVGSRNHKDFMNLMDVYLDAVLHPRIYENHNILKQEGWRYELNDDNTLSYKGVVYSEMMGALSSPEETIINKIYSSLFKGTTYDNVSGGEPSVIPQLTQENFEKFHSKFYHPSNSYIYLYGDMDLDKCLEFIDKEYLDEFERIPVASAIEDAKLDGKMSVVRGSYSINEDEDDNDKEFLALNFAYEMSCNAEAYLTHKILYNMFIESTASPIKRALLDEGIGQSLVTGDDMNMDPTKQLLMPIVVKNVSKGKEDKFKDVVFSTFEKLVKEGIDKDLLASCINTVEFRLREITRNKGLQYNELVLESWLYDGDPTALLNYEKVINHLKEEAGNGYFENFIKKNMINNNHCSLVVLSPEKGLAAKNAEKLAKDLEDYKNSLSEEELNKIKVQNETLRKEQSRKDSEEDKKTMPKLDLSEVDKDIENIPQTIVNKGDITVLKHDIFTGKIEYIDFLFDISEFCEDDIKYISLLGEVLGELNTDKKNYTKLSAEIAKVTGGIESYVNVYTQHDDFTKYSPKFVISAKTVSANINETLRLVNEIITSTKFDDVVRIKEVIKEIKSKLELSVIEKGNVIGVNRVCSMVNSGSKIKEEAEGITYFKFVSDIVKNFETCSDNVISKLKSIFEKVFNKNNLIVSVCGEDEDNDSVINNLDSALNGIPSYEIKENLINDTLEEGSHAVITQSNVQYVIKGYNVAKLGETYSGSMRVLCNILDNEYYYPKVRREGGAYGCYTFLSRNGNIGVFSYRDPNLKRTIDVFDDTYKFLENLELSKNDMDNFIIGTIGQNYKPLTPKMKAIAATSDYISGITEDYKQKEKDEILSTRLEDVKGYAPMFKEIMNKGLCCTVGNEGNIKKNSDLFNVILK